MELPLTQDYKRIILTDIPLLDVRAPVEYSQGAFPCAENIPLLNDEERHLIGLRYKQMGQDKAIELGHKLVCGDTKNTRVQKWADFIQRQPNGVLYCFRGGLRSKITQQWIYEETGIKVPRVEGGYKALRRFLLEQMDESVGRLSFTLLGGRTGSGKTRLLKKIQHHIDLEGLYKHRGSAFGKCIQPQPSQIDIENALSSALLKVSSDKYPNIVLEDESPNIGSRRLPQSIIQVMQAAPIVFLDTQIDTRVDIIFAEYVVEALNEHQYAYGEAAGFDIWSQKLLSALAKIERRLGVQRYLYIKREMDDAIQKQQSVDQNEHHKSWIRKLLIEYYDPMYDYQSRNKLEKTVFRGNCQSVLEYFQNTLVAG